ncbi:TPA: MinD/ParA family protein, partial [Candidatus Poribacteria bacterium]|nr:MinD/ParA family protein [Candidatus Poribacteria bacterium]
MIIDQATKLRELVKPQQHIEFESNEPNRRAVKTIAVTSGKGGVGKTSVVTNLGLLCAIWGYRVAIFDADLSLANVDVLLGVRPHYNLSHVISGEKELSDILAQGPNGIVLIPASCGIESLANLTSTQMERLLNDLEQFTRSMDFLFIDTGAGVSNNVLPFVLAAGEVIIVTTPEPTAITDAYAMIKIITQRRRMINEDGQSLKLLINMVNSSMEAEDVMERIKLVIKRFLDTTVEFGGYILKDERVGEAIMTQNPLVLSSPQSKASKCIFKIAKQIADKRPQDKRTKNFFFEAMQWEQQA